MGSTSATESGGSSSSSLPTDSINSLKFGRKIYFENMCDGVAKSGGGASSSAHAAHKKGRGGLFQSGHPPRCRVEGCNADLSDAKAYYSRHKVCGMHSKFPMVIVAGLEQRFCQQCSRFHQLQEFDQGKRSCRTRLAGHNERRRKPPPGSLFSTQYAPLSPSITENGSRVGSVALDLSAHPELAGREAWSASRSSGGRATESHPIPSTSTGKTRNASSLPVQNSTGTTCFLTHGIPLGECITGVSSCALSLLSNQPWGSSSTHHQAPGVGVHPWMNHQGMPTAKTTPHISSVDQFSSTSWGVYVNEDTRGSSGMTSDLGLCQTWPPCNASYSVALELPHQVRRQYIDLSPQQTHWSL